MSTPPSPIDNILSKLNTAQLTAVNTIEGPVMVLAGPGTGKTQLLAARIANILEATDTAPQNILCLTYTDAGAIAMRKRLFSMIGSEAHKLQIHTFHSFCNKVIQENIEYFGMRELQLISDIETIELYHKLIDGFESNSILCNLVGDAYSGYHHLKKLFEEMKKQNWTAEYLTQKTLEYLESLPYREDYIYKRKTGNAAKGDVNQRKVDAEIISKAKLLAAVKHYDRFQQMMKDNQRYDFNDMLTFVIQAFEQNQNLLLNYQENLLYVLVDEFQDTNGSQSAILNLLTNYWDYPNLFVVGDDDQSIYSFQNAEVERIKDFVKAYQIDTPIILTENYRSTQPILDLAAKLIENNKLRLVNEDTLQLGENAKRLTAANSAIAASKGNIELRTYTNSVQEAVGIALEIADRFKAREDLSDMAIIYRNHADVADIITLFKHLEIPYNAKQKVNIIQEPLIQNVLMVLRYLALEIEESNKGEYLIFELLHFKFWNISPKDITKIAFDIRLKREAPKQSWKSILSDEQKLKALNLTSQKEIIHLYQLLENWQQDLLTLPLPLAIEHIIQQSGMLPHILLQDDKLFQLQVLNTFFNYIKSESNQSERCTLHKFLDTIDKFEKYKLTLPLERIVANADGINLITAHSSKGLEFNTVYMIGCVAQNWEKKRASNNSYSLPDNLHRTLHTHNQSAQLFFEDAKPHKQEASDKLEEDRRLFYVGMTRAKQNLFISFSEMNFKDNNTKESTVQPSLFVNELQLTPQHIEVSDADLCDFLFKKMSYLPINADLEERNYVNQVLERFELSATSLNRYLKCPITFYYENILRIPEARSVYAGFGSAVHYAFEKFFETYKNDENNQLPAADVLTKYFEYGMLREKHNFTEKEYNNRIELGKNLLPEYYTFASQHWTPNIINEYKINTVTADQTPISGSIDRIDIVKAGVVNEIYVHDYKTAKAENVALKTHAPNEKEPYGGEYWRQMIFYSILLKYDTKQSWNMIDGYFDIILQNKEKNFLPPNKIVIQPEHEIFVEKLITEVYTKIKNHEFDQGCEDKDCKWCNFQQTKTMVQ